MHPPPTPSPPFNLTDASVTVMGLGRFGGGVGVTRFLAEQAGCARVLVTDLSPESDLADSLAQLEPLIRRGIVETRLGGHNVSDFTTADLVVANPAVPTPWDNRFLRAALAAGIPLATEIGLLVPRLPSRTNTIAVTGSVGKSTTTAMIAHALRAVLGESAVALGGNIGGTLLNDLPRFTSDTRIVLELSSAMLFWLASADEHGLVRTLDADPAALAHPKWSPAVAVATNLAPNHADWHGTLDHYAASKRALLLAQLPGDTAILGDESVANWAALTRATVQGPHLPRFDRPMALPGEHNRRNAAVALAACAAAIGTDQRSTLAEAIAAFPGLVHRLQFVAEVRGVRYFNDSKSTTPESALRAVEAVAETLAVGARGVHLIAGGYDKKIALDPIAHLAPTLAGLYTIGQTGPALAAAALANGAHAEHVHDTGTLESAFALAVACAKPGEAVVLSPACASWDQFTNFEARGDLFVSLVRAAAGRDHPTGATA
ncbi:MAG: UDP-N-acetylmuramoyl-L-alanine--D-glutamate ligase [Phycisphaeraceae bacterium]|nr:UDP-N-acetylmuramoyl-L-alanine--D-glutamate ligase [Phycisphaeraceae bacterium]